MSEVDDLIAAAKAGDLDGVRALLDDDPSLANVADERGDTPLLVAIYSGANAIVTLLLERGAAQNLFESAALGDTPYILRMLKANPSLASAYSHDGWTALHLAAHFGQIDTARALLEHGADVSLRSRNALDNLPLHAALAGREHPPLVTLLLDAGSDVNARQHGDYTALHAAAQNGYAETARLLLARGADMSIVADDGKTALQLAQEQGHDAVVALLREHGARG